MTCIVGIISGKKVIIGGDSAGVSNLDITIRRDPKVFRVGKFIIGCTSSFRMIQLLQFSFKPPKRKKKEVYEYMCTDFIDAVRKCFKEGGYLQKYRLGDEKGGTFLVGYKGRLFEIEDDFQVAEPLDGFCSVGCGSDYAIGSLCTTENTKLTAEDRVLKALEVATKRSGGVEPPYIILKY